MKKITCILVIGVMLLSILPFAVGADGAILFSDDFESGTINEKDWYPGAFAVNRGGPTDSYYVEDWAGWHVLQSMYNNNGGPERTYGANVAFKVDAWAWEDGGDNREEHALGLWWADYFDAAGDAGRIVYQFTANFEKRQAILNASGEGDGEAYFPDSVDVGVWDIPASVSFNMDYGDPSLFTLGMRVNGQQIDCYFNGQKVISYTAPRMGNMKSPILMTNNGCYAGFDNFVVSTADYDLFNEGAAINNNPIPDNNNDSPSYETVVVTDTDAEGNVVTRVETRPVANNGGAAIGGNAAKTGDIAIVAIIVMAVALGSAVVVKKIGERR